MVTEMAAAQLALNVFNTLRSIRELPPRNVPQVWISKLQDLTPAVVTHGDTPDFGAPGGIGEGQPPTAPPTANDATEACVTIAGPDARWIRELQLVLLVDEGRVKDFRKSCPVTPAMGFEGARELPVVRHSAKGLPRAGTRVFGVKFLAPTGEYWFLHTPDGADDRGFVRCNLIPMAALDSLDDTLLKKYGKSSVYP